MTLEEAQASTSFIRGMILVDNISAHTLFNTGATRSFISFEFVCQLERNPVQIPIPFMVSGPSGKIFSSDLVLNIFQVKVGRKILRANFIVLPMIEFDVILGMN